MKKRRRKILVSFLRFTQGLENAGIIIQGLKENHIFVDMMALIFESLKTDIFSSIKALFCILCSLTHSQRK